MTQPLPPSYEQSTTEYGYGPAPVQPTAPPVGVYSDPAYPPQSYGSTAYPEATSYTQPLAASASPRDNGESGGFTAKFNEKNVRRLFIRKVYITLSVQLLVTFGITAIVYFIKPVKDWVRTDGAWMYYLAYAVFLVTYITLVCCPTFRRKSPQNIVALSVFTLALSYMVAMITTFYDIESVLIAFGITCGITIGVTIFSMQTKFDFTLCGGFLFMFSLSLFIFGFIAIFTYSQILYTVYAWLGAVLFSLFLAYDTQLIMGGKRYELDPEEYIYGALCLYIDIVYIFIFILSIVGGKN
ncbi:protein lifeguard 1-like isoform X2 [Anneissia japonica]|uniref:protein lifeguard 1-like isoform X2 n=1 Tax=Anneissia japonica TaxID=1529436 RepID=UPI00142570C4|nr:protein lifeguard 1-like isoform X2 [Anneissia japonica]